MLKPRSLFSFSPLTLCYGIVGTLSVVYIGLIALIMSSAVLTIEFSQSVKDNEAIVAVLEARYLASVAEITAVNYLAEGYVPSRAKGFVKAENVAALR